MSRGRENGGKRKTIIIGDLEHHKIVEEFTDA